MASRFLRLIAICLVAFLSAMLIVQSPSLAGRHADYDDPDVTIARHENPGGGGGVGGSGSPWWNRFTSPQGRPIRDRGVSPSVREGAEGRNPSNDRERREMTREVTGEQHTPGGGPLER